MKELLELLTKEIPVMEIKLTMNILGMNIEGGFSKKGLEAFCDINDVKEEDVEDLYHKHLSQSVRDFSKALDDLLRANGKEVVTIDRSKEK